MNNGIHNDPFLVSDDNCSSVVISGKMYSVSTHFSLNDAEVYLSCLEETGDHKRAIATIIYNKLKACEEPISTIEEVMNEDDSAFSNFILAIVNDDHELKDYFDKTGSSLPVTQRFAIAYKNYYDYYTKKLTDAISPSLEQFEHIRKIIDFSWLNKVQQITNSFQPAWLETVRQATQVAQLTAKVVSPIQNMINEYAHTFSDLISNIEIPTISPEDKERLVENYKKWGSLGWTIIPNAPMNLFSGAPININDANTKAMLYDRVQ